jgi:hypothetical protein
MVLYIYDVEITKTLMLKGVNIPPGGESPWGRQLYQGDRQRDRNWCPFCVPLRIGATGRVRAPIPVAGLAPARSLAAARRSAGQRGPGCAGRGAAAGIALSDHVLAVLRHVADLENGAVRQHPEHNQVVPERGVALKRRRVSGARLSPRIHATAGSPARPARRQPVRSGRRRSAGPSIAGLLSMNSGTKAR